MSLGLNREQRRAMKRRMEKSGRRVVTLEGGAMDGWVVTPDAPCLRPDWWETWPERVGKGRYVLSTDGLTASWVVDE